MNTLKIILSFLFIFQSVASQIVSYINIEKGDYCLSLNNEKHWIEKQLSHHSNILNNYRKYQDQIHNIEVSYKELNMLRKEVSQMIYQMCTNKDEL